MTVTGPSERFSTLKLPSGFSDTFAVAPEGTDTTVRPPPRTTSASPSTTRTFTLPHVTTTSPPADTRSVKPQTLKVTRPVPGPTVTRTPSGAGSSATCTVRPARSVIVPEVPAPSENAFDATDGSGSIASAMPSPSASVTGAAGTSTV